MPQNEARNSVAAKERIEWIDTVRALAILCVIICHVTECVFHLNMEYFPGYPLMKQIAALSLFTLGRLGVPLFFFITGFLLLDREFDEGKTKLFYKNNLLNLLITTEIWILMYNIFNSVFYQEPFRMEEYLRNALFLKNTNISHMWYMPVIFGIYMTLPFAAKMLHNANRFIFLPLGVAFICLFITPELNVVLRSFGKETVSAVLDLSFMGGVYGLYAVIGYYFRKYDCALRKISASVFCSMMLVMAGATVAVQLCSYHRGIGYNVWYSNATLAITAFCLMVLVSRIPVNCFLLNRLSKYSFAMYLLHNPILMVLNRCITFTSSFFRFVFLFAATTGISLLLSAVLCRERHLARYAFFQK